MENRKHNIEELPRDNRASYRVPEGYFAELNNTLCERAEKPVQGGLWATFRSLTAFAGIFAIMVIMAITGFYFTGHQAQQSEVEQDALYFTELYHVTTDDIIDAEMEQITGSGVLIADAAAEYLDTYGYSLIDITEK